VNWFDIARFLFGEVVPYIIGGIIGIAAEFLGDLTRADWVGVGAMIVFLYAVGRIILRIIKVLLLVGVFIASAYTGYMVFVGG